MAVGRWLVEYDGARGSESRSVSMQEAALDCSQWFRPCRLPSARDAAEESTPLGRWPRCPPTFSPSLALSLVSDKARQPQEHSISCPVAKAGPWKADGHLGDHCGT